MRRLMHSQRQKTWLVFAIVFILCLGVGGIAGFVIPANAAPAQEISPQITGYLGSETCKGCHLDIYNLWENTRHAQAFSSPIFQRDWSDLGSKTSCLSCHTTGFDPNSGKYAQEGVSCESCHGPFQAGHPAAPMSVQPNEDLCATCHKTTTDEWRASVHSQQGITCKDCHNPHSQMPKAASVNELCANCHKEREDSFTHGTHAQSGLECSNCHMYSAPRSADPIEGLVATGHTFAVGSETCIACHQDTVHTRDEIVKLTGEVTELTTVDVDQLHQEIAQKDAEITSLQSSSTVRLYTGLAQGAIIGLITGAVAAWIVSQRIRYVEVGENE
jgi:predicted CXXCH cytochrome family protein